VSTRCRRRGGELLDQVLLAGVESFDVVGVGCEQFEAQHNRGVSLLGEVQDA
jgi:hypothetical protein